MDNVVSVVDVLYKSTIKGVSKKIKFLKRLSCRKINSNFIIRERFQKIILTVGDNI
jgi:hypothetical protein